MTTRETGPKKAGILAGMGLVGVGLAYSLFPSRDEQVGVSPGDAASLTAPALPTVPPDELPTNAAVRTAAEGAAPAVEVQAVSPFDAAIDLRNRGLALFQQGQMEAGLQLLEDSLDAARAALGDREPQELLPFLRPLASCSKKAEQIDRAADLLKEEHRILKELGDKANPDERLACAASLGDCLTLKGLGLHAREFLEEAKLLSGSPLEVSKLGGQLDMIDLLRSENKALQPGIQKLFEQVMTKEGAGSEAAFRSGTDLARFCLLNNDPASALKAIDALLGENNPSSMFTFRREELLRLKASAMMANAKTAEGGAAIQDLLKETQRLADRRLARHPELLADEARQLSSIAARAGGDLAAAEVLSPAVDALERRHGAAHPLVGILSGEAARRYEEAGQPGMAAAYRNRALSCILHYNESARQCAVGRDVAGTEHFLQQVLNIADAGLGRRSQESVSAAIELRNFYAQQGRMEDAARMDRIIQRKTS